MITLSHFTTFAENRISFPIREGFIPTNASVTVWKGWIWALVCCGDHFMDERGHYTPFPPGTPEDPERYSQQTVYLVRLAHNFKVVSAREIAVPQRPACEGETFRGFRGFDSARLFVWQGALWSAMCAMGTGARPGSQFFLARIEGENTDEPRFTDLRRVSTNPPKHAEKNWMPEVVNDQLRFHYRVGILADLEGNLTASDGWVDLLHLNGGSQVISNGYPRALCIAHHFEPREGTHLRRYLHYFVKLHDGRPEWASSPFTITNRPIEIVTGMAYHPDGRMMISYGREGASGDMPNQEMPFIATIRLSELRRRRFL